VLPHARITIGPDGVIRIAGASLMRGYLGEPDLAGEFITPDLGALVDTGQLQVFGRRDEVIISGGEKINLREIEAVLRESGCFADVAVLAVPSEDWGEVPVACYVSVPDAVGSEDAVNRSLARHQRPKHWLAFTAAEWPRNAQGKLNRATLQAAVSARLHPSS
jgi:O-succinylbenzoic acid--CoA ligase